MMRDTDMGSQPPRIAIPTPTSTDLAYNKRCWHQYASAVAAAGGAAVEVPLTLQPAEAAKLASSCAGLLLPGSPADVHPQKYGQPARPETATPDPLREATDELLLQDAFHLKKPLLGVCFGLQMLNVWRGGTLVQHLDTGQPHSPGSGNPPLTHSLKLLEHALLLQACFGDTHATEINSSHHQAVDQPGDGLVVAGLSAVDGVVEAVESKVPEDQWVLGVQWHPERSYSTDEPSRALFGSFIDAARRWHLPHA